MLKTVNFITDLGLEKNQYQVPDHLCLPSFSVSIRLPHWAAVLAEDDVLYFVQK